MMVKGYHNTPSTLGDMVNWQLFSISLGQNSSNDVCVVIHNYMTGWYLRSESAYSFVISFYHYLYQASDVMVVL